MAKQQALRILKSWHLIEFFQTYSVEEEEQSIQIPASELQSYGDPLLPWLNKIQQQRIGMKNENVRYILHLGLFPKSAAESVSDRLFGKDQSDLARYEQEQRLDTDGMTCFAKLTLDKEGTPDFKNISVSTLPWALGHLQRGTATELTVAAFNERTALLREQLDRLSILLPTHAQSGKPYLTAALITKLLKILCDWAEYSPSSPFALQLDWKQLKKTEQTEEKAVLQLTSVKASHEPEKGDETGLIVSDDEPENSEDTLPILNSFFLEDIERAMLAVAQDEGGEALLQYLSIRQNRHADLYSDQGLEKIIAHLSPEYMPQGRWPSDPRFSLSLMQQFSINTALQALRDGGLLSVNGPPGTGKTTMLRDLVAHNVVERAKILASFSQASDALDKNGFLDKRLTGFEMVVASYNNAAVENISRELPQRKSLAKEFCEAEYLRPVANQLGARTNRKGQFVPLEEGEQCWGLIAAILGNKTNRNKFIQRLLFSKHYEADSANEAHPPEEFNLLNFWRWYKTASPLSFDKAKENFTTALRKVEQLQDNLQQLAKLTEWLRINGDGTAISMLKKRHEEWLIQRQKTEDLLAQQQQQNSLFDERVSILNEEQQMLLRNLPGWWQRLFRRTHYQTVQRQLEEVNQELIKVRKQRLASREELAAAEKELRRDAEEEKSAWEAWSSAEHELQDAKARHASLLKIYPEVIVPGPEHSIRDADTQRFAFWQDETINRLRSQLFIAAMALHQSWLPEATRRHSAFRNNLFTLSQFLNSPHSESNTLGMWQLLFMIVPVVSTTFASLGRMFKGVSQAELGWLLIDEAGQALPQAAVGALWRTKRVLVVGDPLQIEPVFVTPPRLTQHLTEAILANDAEEWTPAKWSVQQIADRANPYGCTLSVMNKPVWVGIPLWVHRRCIDPMFSMANRLAYDNRMIHGLSDQAILSKPLAGGLSNCWYLSEGECIHKQYKSELGRDTETLLRKLSAADYKLDDIYVITPFKAVRSGLASALEREDVVNRLTLETGMTRTELKAWRNKHLGTVHTFQGKENDIIILVLGCDTTRQGGAEWASSKPNLLNVALTRAKNHIFVIGDRSVWSNKAGFDLLAQALPERMLY